MENTGTVLRWGLPHIETIHLYPTLPSTNTLAKDLINSGCAHGTVVWALQQTAGRGRQGRVWFADNNSLTFSVIWRLPDYAKMGLLPLAVGLGIVRELQIYSPAIKVKWPNDLWVGRRKLGGILCESRRRQGELWVVVGVGINVNRMACAPAFPMVSLEECWGRPISRLEVLGRVLTGLDRAFAQVKVGGELDLNSEFRRLGNFLDQPVCLISHGKTRHATARRVLPNGRLLVEKADGSWEAVMAEEVSLRFTPEDASSEHNKGNENSRNETD